MKTCSCCKETKALSEFNKKGPRLQPYCRPCQQTYRRQYYKDNTERYRAVIDKGVKRRRKLAQELVAKLKQAPCTNCGGHFKPWQMDFDHDT